MAETKQISLVALVLAPRVGGANRRRLGPTPQRRPIRLGVHPCRRVGEGDTALMRSPQEQTLSSRECSLGPVHTASTVDIRNTLAGGSCERTSHGQIDSPRRTMLIHLVKNHLCRSAENPYSTQSARSERQHGESSRAWLHTPQSTLCVSRTRSVGNEDRSVVRRNPIDDPDELRLRWGNERQDSSAIQPTVSTHRFAHRVHE